MFCPDCGTQTDNGQKFCANCGKDLRALSPRPSRPPPLPPSVPRHPGASAVASAAIDPADVYAAFFRRLLALILDYLIVAVVFGVGVAVFGANEKGADDGLRTLSMFVVAWLYKAGMECSSKQGTLGKLALGIKVVSLEGERIGFGRATGRFFALLLSAITMYVG